MQTGNMHGHPDLRGKRMTSRGYVRVSRRCRSRRCRISYVIQLAWPSVGCIGAAALCLAGEETERNEVIDRVTECRRQMSIEVKNRAFAPRESELHSNGRGTCRENRELNLRHSYPPIPSAAKPPNCQRGSMFFPPPTPTTRRGQDV